MDSFIYVVICSYRIKMHFFNFSSILNVFYSHRYELSAEMKEGCKTLATYLEDSTTIQTKELVIIFMLFC